MEVSNDFNGRTINVLIIFGVYLIPCVSILEVLALVNGTLISQAQIITPMYVKGLKDLVLLLLVLAFAFQRRTLYSFYLISLVMSALMAFLALFFLKDYLFSLIFIPVIFVSGVRWLLPLVLLLLSVGNVRSSTLLLLEKHLFRVFVFHFILQLIELFFAPPWFGVNFLGLNARNPGLFLIPNTGALFTLLCCYLSFFYSGGKRSGRFYLMIYAISVALTASGAGFATLLAMFAFILFYKYRVIVLYPFIFIFLPLLSSLLLQFVSHIRGGDVSESPLTRIDILKETITENFFFPDKFGNGTNTAVLFSPDTVKILDTTWASMTANFGFLITFIILLIFAIILFFSDIFNKKKLTVILIIVLIFSFTTIINEVYPANILIPIIIASMCHWNKSVNMVQGINPQCEN